MINIKKTIDLAGLAITFILLSIFAKSLAAFLFVPFIFLAMQLLGRTRYCQKNISCLMSPVDGSVLDVQGHEIHVAAPYTGFYTIYAPVTGNMTLQAEEHKKMILHPKVMPLMYESTYTFKFQPAYSNDACVTLKVVLVSLFRAPIYDSAMLAGNVIKVDKSAPVAHLALGHWCKKITIDTTSPIVIKGMTLIAGETFISGETFTSSK